MSSMTLFGGKQSALLAGVENNLTTTLAGNGGVAPIVVCQLKAACSVS